MHPLVPLLTGGAPPRTWSILVTIMGDMGAEPGARLTGPLLARLTEGMGIRPPALRTALHRLRREGWIESVRAGRVTSHALTVRGRAETLAARTRIYGPGPSGALHLVVLGPGEEAREGVVALGGEIALAAGPAGWSVPIHAPPGWMAERVAPPALRVLAGDVAGRLEALSGRLDEAADFSDPVILRLLVLHLWRRLALRMPPLPEAAFPPGWQGGRARRLAHDLLARLPPGVPDATSRGGRAVAAPGADQNGESG